MRRKLAFILSASLILGMFPVSAGAAEPGFAADVAETDAAETDREDVDTADTAVDDMTDEGEDGEISNNDVLSDNAADETAAADEADDPSMYADGYDDYVAIVMCGTSTEGFPDINSAVERWNDYADGAILKLLDDVETDSVIGIAYGLRDKPMVLDLNDHGILYKGSEDSNVIGIASGGVLKITDTAATRTKRFITLSESGGHSGRGTEVSTEQPSTGSHIEVTGGYITGGFGTSGSGVACAGTLIMNDGTICGNQGDNGPSGIWIAEGGSFTMNGGEFSNNRYKRYNSGTYEYEYKYNCIYCSGTGNVSFGRNVIAGENPDKTDSSEVTREKAKEDFSNYGYIHIDAAQVSPKGGEAVTFGNFDGAVNALSSLDSEATLKLLNDVETDESAVLSGGTEEAPHILDLNDHGIIYKGGYRVSVLCIDTGSYIEIKDSTPKTRHFITYADGRGNDIAQENPGAGVSFNEVTGGFITGGTAGKGAGIYNEGTLILNGGTICCNKATDDGGGLYNSDGSVCNMKKGEIGCNFALNGAGVYNAGTFTIAGDEIKDNHASNGGGVFNSGTLNLVNGGIYNNTAENGGSVYNIDDKIFTMIGGSVSEKKENKEGSSIYNAGIFNMTNGSINNSTGCGVYNTGSFTVSGGSINDSAGHGVNNAGTFIMNSGQINRALGCGVYNTGIFSLNNGYINYCSDQGVNNAGTFNMTEGYIRYCTGCGISNNGVATFSGGFIMENAGYGVDNKSTFKMTGGEIKAGSNEGKLAFNNDNGTLSFEGDIYVGEKSDGSNAAMKKQGDVIPKINTYGYIAVFSRGDPVAKVVTKKGKTTNYSNIYMAVKGWNGAGDGATLKLLEDLNVSESIEVSGGSKTAPLVLDLNDHGIKASGIDIIKVNSGAYFELKDSSGKNEHYIGDSKRGVYNEGTFIMTGGMIKGCCATDGSGVYNTGTFTMNGGKICENRLPGYWYTFLFGAGVYNSGSFILNGGEICDNFDNDVFSCGGGVTNDKKGIFTMNGGSIHGNKTCNAGAVWNVSTATFVMNGGEIYDNTTTHDANGLGCAITIWGGSFIMKGGKIYDNNSPRDGLALYLQSSYGTVTFNGDVKAGTAKDGSDAREVTLDEANNNFGTYRYIEVTGSHVFTYTAKGATITAKCSAKKCRLKNRTASLKLEAPEGDLVYDGKYRPATVSGDTAILGTPGIAYTKKYDPSFTGVPKDAGTYTASISLGEGKNKATASVTYTISERPVTVSGLNAVNKEYDGTSSVVIDTTGALLSGKVEGEDLNVASAAGHIEDAEVGESKPVFITGITLAGAGLRNYVLDREGSQKETVVNINKVEGRTVTLSSNAAYGSTGVVDLNEYAGEGGRLGVITVNDPKGVLDGDPVVRNRILQYSLKDNADNISETATLTIPVTGSRNYLDHNIEITLKVAYDENYDGLKEEIKTASGDAISLNTVKDGETTTIDVMAGGSRVSRKVISGNGYTVESSNVWIGGLEEGYRYTGSAIKPKVSVYDGTRKLTAKEYAVGYKNNKNIGSKAILTITLKGNYRKLSKTLKFTIEPARIGRAGDSNIEASAADMVIAETGKNQKPVPAVTWESNGKAVKKTFFEYTYYDESNNKVSAIKTPGTYKVVVKPKPGAKSYTGEATVNVQVIPKAEAGKMLSKSVIKFTPAKYTYTGSPITPDSTAYTAKLGGRVLKKGVDYTVEFTKNTEPGKAVAVFTAAPGSGLYGSKKVNFTIVRGRVLQEQKKGSTFTYEFRGVDGASLPLVKGGVKPELTVKDNGTVLIPGVDYTLAYKNNKAVAKTDAKDKKGRDIAPYVIVKGKGKYKGSVFIPFEITKQDLDDMILNGGSITAADKTVGRKGFKDPVITLTDTDGRKLKSGSDFFITKYLVTHKDGTTAGPVAAADVATVSANAGDMVEVTVSGNGSYRGQLCAEYRYISNASNLGKLGAKTIPAKVFTGRDIVLTDADLTNVLYTGSKRNPEYLVPGVDFKVIGYKNNRNKGTAAVTVQGIGDKGFGGVRTLKFKIVPKDGLYTGVLLGGRMISSAD